MFRQARRGAVVGRGALDGAVAGAGTARQVAIPSPVFGLIEIDSGATVRQTELPGTSVNEGTQ